eukprot:2384215-Pyramimonas_sp.AAC.1
MAVVFHWSGGGRSGLMVSLYSRSRRHCKVVHPALSNSAMSPAGSLHLPFLSCLIAWWSSLAVKGGMV